MALKSDRKNLYDSLREQAGITDDRKDKYQKLREAAGNVPTIPQVGKYAEEQVPITPPVAAPLAQTMQSIPMDDYYRLWEAQNAAGQLDPSDPNYYEKLAPIAQQTAALHRKITDPVYSFFNNEGPQDTEVLKNLQTQAQNASDPNARAMAQMQADALQTGTVELPATANLSQQWQEQNQRDAQRYAAIRNASDYAANLSLRSPSGFTSLEAQIRDEMGNADIPVDPNTVVRRLRDMGATDQEINNFVYLYNTQGWREAEAYYQHILPSLNERMRATEEARARQYANEHGVKASLVSTPYNLAGGLAGAIDFAWQNAQANAAGRPVNYNTPAQQTVRTAQVMREQVGQNVSDWAVKKALEKGASEERAQYIGQIAGFLYQTSQSMQDSAATMLMAGMGVPNAAYFLGASAGVSAAQEAKQRGATDEQAFAAGVLAGVAEEFFEEYSIDRWFRLDSPKSVADLARNIIKQAIPEASEELATSLANFMTEQIILGDKSAFQTNVKKYMDDGLSKADAVRAATQDFARDLALDALGGALSGGVFGAFGGVGQTMNQIRQGADVRREGQTTNLVNSALGLTGTESARMAEQMDNASDLAVGRLAQQVQDDSVKAAEIMLKQSRGEALTADEQAFITPFQQQTAPATQEQQTVAQETTQSAQNAPAEAQTANITSEENTAPAASEAVERTPAQQEYDNAINSTVRRMIENDWLDKGIEGEITDEFVQEARERNRRSLADETEYNMSAQERNAMNPFLKALAATGRKIRYEDFSKTMPREKWANVGYFDTKTNEIVLNKSLSVNPGSENAAKLIRKVILHEMGHTLRQTKAYDRMYKFIKDSYAGDEAWQNRLQDEVNKRAKQGEFFDLSKDEDFKAVEEEVVVDEMADLLKDSRNVARLIKDDRSLAQKIYDGIHDFLGRVGSVKDAKARAELRDLRTAEKLLGQALKEDNAQKKAPRSVNQQMLEEQTAKKNAPKKAETRKSSGTSEKASNKNGNNFSGDTISAETEAEYDRLAKDPKKNRSKLETMVRQAAEAAMPNSKIRDEDGNLRVVYHGTDADFTVFDRAKGRANMDIQGSFFSPWAEDSEGYGSRVGRYYLDITNPASEGVAYKALNRFKGQNNAGVKAREYLESLGYDGVNNGDEEYIAFRSEQIKSADPVTYDNSGNIIPLQDRFDPSKPDIRWSSDTITDAILADMREEADREAEAQAERVSSSVEGAYDTAKELAAAKKEIARLSEKLAYWKQQTRLTKTPSIDEKAVAKQARAWLKEYGATDQGLAGAVTDLYNDLLRGDIDFSEAHDRATDIAKDMVDSIVVKDTSFADQYKDFTDSLKDSPIVLTKDEARGIDNFNDLRKSHFGKVAIRVVDNLANETSLDRRYQELTSEYPEFFPEDVLSTEDKLQKIFDAADQIYDSKNRVISPFDNDVEGAEAVAADLANEILERFYDIPQVRTAADRLMQSQAVRTAGIVNRMQERSEAQIERLEQKQAEALAKMQERNQKKIDRLLQKQADMIAHNKEVRERRQARRQEKEVSDRLLKMARKLSKVKTTPELAAIRDELIGDYDLVSKGMREKGFLRESDGVLVRGRLELEELRDAIERKQKEDHDFIAPKSVLDTIGRINKKHIADLTIDEQRDLLRALQELDHQIRTYNKEVGVARAKTFSELSRNAIAEVKTSRGTSRNASKLKAKARDLYVISSLRPETFFAEIGGFRKNGVLSQMYQQFEDGQTKQLKFEMEATTPFDEFAKEHKREMAKWSGKNSEIITLRDVEGNPVLGDKGRPIQFNPAMRISLYLHSLNDQNMRHITYGGIKVPDMGVYTRTGDMAEAYARGQTIKLTRTDIDSIASQMTEAERKFADLVYHYFNVVSKKALNETSLVLRGYEVAQVENYFPIKSDTDFISSNFDGLFYNGTLDGMGFLKERNDATNPIMLEAVDSVLTRQIGDTAKYVGLAIPIRNFYGGQIVGGQSAGGLYKWNSNGDTLVKEIGDKWGEAANQYLEKLSADLQHPKRNGSKLMDTIRGNYAAAVLNFNPAVAFGQFASYPTAADTLGWEALAKGLTMGRADIDLIAKYTPLLWYRSKGYVDTELGNIKNYGSRSAQVMVKLPGAKWVQKVDLFTIRRIWNASEAWVQLNTDLEQGTDEYYRKTAEMFNKAVYQTQPNYTTLQRPQILRSDSEIERNLFMFATQRMQNYNMMYQSLGEMAEAKRNGNRESFGKLAGKAASTAATLLIANAVYTAMRNAVRRGIHKDDDKWVNEEGQITLLNGLMHGFVKNMAGSVVLGSEAADFVAALSKGQYYDTFTIPSIETINSLLRTSKNFMEETTNLISSGYPLLYLNQNPKFFKYAKDLAFGLAQMFGAPVENYEKYILGVMKWFSPHIAKRWENLTVKPTKKDVYDANTSAEEKAAFNAYMVEATGKANSGLYDMWMDASPDVEDKYFPPQMTQTFAKDHGLDVKQFADMSEMYEQDVSNNLEGVIDKVRRSNEEIQVSALNSLYDYSEAKAKASVTDYSRAKWMLNVDACVAAGIPLSDVCVYRAEGEYQIDHRDKTDKKVGAKDVAEEYIESIRPKLTQKQKRALFSVLSDAKNPYEEEQG